MREIELRSSPNKSKNMEIKTGIIYCKNLNIFWNQIRDHLNIFLIIFLKFQLQKKGEAAMKIILMLRTITIKTRTIIQSQRLYRILT